MQLGVHLGCNSTAKRRASSRSSSTVDPPTRPPRVSRGVEHCRCTMSAVTKSAGDSVVRLRMTAETQGRASTSAPVTVREHYRDSEIRRQSEGGSEPVCRVAGVLQWTSLRSFTGGARHVSQDFDYGERPWSLPRVSSDHRLPPVTARVGCSRWGGHHCGGRYTARRWPYHCTTWAPRVVSSAAGVGRGTLGSHGVPRYSRHRAGTATPRAPTRVDIGPLGPYSQ